MKHVNKGVVDRYHIVFTVIAIVTEMPKQTLVNSFQRVGLDPLNRPTWNEWVDRIKPFLQGGAPFKTEEDIDMNGKYAMLTEYFHGMKTEEKKSMMGIMEKHSKCLSLECVREIHSSLSIPLSDMQSLRVCVTLCYQHPEMIKMEIPHHQDA